jgi:hypothetical protein
MNDTGTASSSTTGEENSLRGPGEGTNDLEQSLRDRASGFSKSIKDETKALGSEAQHAAEQQADNVKNIAASHMDVFADALRAASDQLSRDQSGPAAEMVAHAASGLEGLSRSLHGKSTGEIIETVRQFGRDNPIGFLAGSVLAGVALGRFTAAGTPPSTAKPDGSRPGMDGSPSTSTRDDRGMTQ